MKRFATGIGLLVSLAFALLIAPAGAQESTPIDPMMGDEGLESVVSRSWSIDYANASPMATADLPELQMVIIMVMRYDTPSHAYAGFDLFIRDMADQMESDQSLGDIDVEVIDGVGETATSINSTVTETEGTWQTRLSIAREGQYLYLVTAIGADAERVAAADDLLAGMVNDSDPGEGDGTFAEDGTSTGGPWDVMPADDHPALAGLINYGDTMELLATTPES